MNALTRLAWCSVGLGLLVYLALTLWLGIVGLMYPYQLDYGEGIVLWFARQLAHGQPIYKGLTDLPYASSNYPPVALLLAAMLMPLLGDGYSSGRLLNFVAALSVTALIYHLVYGETRDRRAGILAALFFFGSPYIYHWIPLFRVDLIGLAFAFAGVYVLWKFDRHSPTADRRTVVHYVLCLTVLFLLALYTKHSLIAAPLAAFLTLWQRGRRIALAFAFALGTLGSALYLALDVVTRGGFTFGIIESNATVFLLEQLGTLVQNFVSTFPILLLLALWSWTARVRAKQMGALEWYAVTTFAALVMAGRVGAWENYFFEALAIVCVFAGFTLDVSGFTFHVSRFTFQVSGFTSYISRLLPPAYRLLPPASRLLTPALYPLLLFAQLVLMWHDPRIAADLIARDTPANEELARVLARTSGLIISEDMGALVTSGKPVVYYTFQYSALAQSDKWDQQWELNGLRDGQFALVILERGTRENVEHYRRFTRQFVSTLDHYYARTRTIGKYELYTFAPLAHRQTAQFGDALTLIGWSLPEDWNTDPLNLTIVWQAQRALARRYTAFVHLETASSEKIAQDDREPLGGIYPTTRWAAYEMVRDVYTLRPARALTPGTYVLRVGWYDSATGERLPVAESVDDAVLLTTLQVK